jgi:hypothetical protein
MSWFLIAVISWVAVAAPLALVIGRSVRVADEALVAPSSPAVPGFVPAEWVASATGSR